MYKYSKKAQDRFLSFPVQAFLLAAYALSDEGLDFLKGKAVIKGTGQSNQIDEEKLKRLQNDLITLKVNAVECLQGQN